MTREHVMRAMSPHGHLFFELIIVVSGTGRHTIDGVTHDARSGSVFVLPPGSIHDLRDFSDADAWSVIFLADSMDSMQVQGLTPLDNLPIGLLFDVFRQPALRLLPPIQLDELGLRQVADLIQRLDDELTQRLTGYEHAVRSAMQLLSVTLARYASAITHDYRISGDHQDLVSRAFADIDQHYRDGAALSKAAERLGLTNSYLTTKLRRLTGRTYGDWVIERRMIEARRLLVTTELSIGEIADMLGYAEIASFIRRFRSRHQMTPAAWRESSFSTPH